jgi:hypothetical protein
VWQTVGGGESPGLPRRCRSDSNFVWSSASGYGAVGGIVSRHDLRTGLSRQLEVWPEATIGHSAAEVKYRFQWNFPIHVSPHDPKTLYVGSQHLHVTRDYGQSLAGDQPRSLAQRSLAHGDLGWPHAGQHRRGVRGCDHVDRRVAGGARG